MLNMRLSSIRVVLQTVRVLSSEKLIGRESTIGLDEKT